MTWLTESNTHLNSPQVQESEMAVEVVKHGAEQGFPFHLIFNNGTQKLTREAAVELKNNLARVLNDTCTHKGYEFSKHGRRCFKCGNVVVDFGD